MVCKKRGRVRKDGPKHRGKEGDRGEEGANRKCQRRMCHGHHRRMLYIGILVSMIFLHIAAWSSREFCDWYLEHVFGIWVTTYGRLTGLVPFSVGEILIGLGAGFGILGAVLGAMWLIGKAAACCWGDWRRSGIQEEVQRKGPEGNRTSGEVQRKGSEGNRTPGEVQGKGLEGNRTSGEVQRKGLEQSRVLGGVRGKRPQQNRVLEEGFGKEPKRRSRLGRFCRAYCTAGLWILLGAFVLMTLNCYILYHGSGFSGTYFTGEDRDYTLEELAALRNYVVRQCNALCCQIPRNEDGSLSYEGDMLETAKAAMRHLGETYEGLGGFYPTPKPLRSSDFMSQQHIAGCYYPFSMEANYNDVMYVMNLPSTLCHELGHLKGYVLEDEANLIGYLACVQSEDIFFQYSGYLSVLYYVDNDFRQAMESSTGSGREISRQGKALRERETQEQSEALRQKEIPEKSEVPGQEEIWGQPQDLRQVSILPQVHSDNIFLTTQERTRIEQGAFLDTEAVDVISDSIADASLKLNGVQDGMISYSRVVELLLRYYDIYGYP